MTNAVGQASVNSVKPVTHQNMRSNANIALPWDRRPSSRNNLACRVVNSQSSGIDPSAIFLVDEKRRSRNRLEYELALLNCPRNPCTDIWRNICKALTV